MVVFITLHPEFALKGFELSALDYVLKPLTEERFAQAAGKIGKYREMKQNSEAYEVLFEKDMLKIKENLIRSDQLSGTLFIWKSRYFRKSDNFAIEFIGATEISICKM